MAVVGTVRNLTDANAPAIRGYDIGTASGANTAWTPNAVNASFTWGLSAMASAAQSFSMLSTLKYYRQQEVLYIQNATEQARRIKLKGEIALRNLQVQHSLKQGVNTLAAATSGGRLSGSALDMLTTNHKYNIVDQRTSALSSLWEEDNARRQGYINAIATAGTAMSTASQAAGVALGGLFKGISAAAGDLLADKRTYDTENTTANIQNEQMRRALDALLKRGGSMSSMGLIEEEQWNPLNISGRGNTLMSGYPIEDPINTMGLIEVI